MVVSGQDRSVMKKCFLSTDHPSFVLLVLVHSRTTQEVKRWGDSHLQILATLAASALNVLFSEMLKFSQNYFFKGDFFIWGKEIRKIFLKIF
jgi:hypothetical protein